MREILDGLPGHIWPDGSTIDPYEGLWPDGGKLSWPDGDGIFPGGGKIAFA